MVTSISKHIRLQRSKKIWINISWKTSLIFLSIRLYIWIDSEVENKISFVFWSWIIFARVTWLHLMIFGANLIKGKVTFAWWCLQPRRKQCKKIHFVIWKQIKKDQRFERIEVYVAIWLELVNHIQLPGFIYNSKLSAYNLRHWVKL